MQLESNNIVFGDNQYLETSMLTPSSEDADYPIENIVDTIRSRVFKPLSNTFTIDIDLEVNASVKLIALFGPISEYFGISDAATITIKANNINDFVTPAYTDTMTIDENGAYLFIDAATNTDFRYWQVGIDDNTNPDIIKHGYLYKGDITQPQSKTINKGFRSKIVDPTKKLTTIDGSEFFNEKQKFNRIDGLALGYVPIDDRLVLEKMYWDNGKATPMVISLDPNLKISNSYSNLTKLMKWEDSPNVVHNFDDVYSMSFTINEVR